VSVEFPDTTGLTRYAVLFVIELATGHLDHVIVLTEAGLRRVLASYVAYYQQSLTRLSLDKDSPHPRPVAPAVLGSIVAMPQVGGLHHRYDRRAA
jgi:hypothetical protein